jgi:hypothetical protein
MPSEVVMFTGSRKFAGHPAALRWARSVILREAASVLERTDRLRFVMGDAEGIDDLAEDIARALNSLSQHINYSVFRLDAQLIHSDRHNERWTADTPPAMFDTDARRKWPLTRNRAMVARVAAFPIRACVGIRCPWAATAGTSFTVDRAREAGIETRVYDCPPELRGMP